MTNMFSLPKRLQEISDKLDRILAAVEKKKQPKHGMEVRRYDSDVFNWFWLHYPHRNGRKLGRKQALMAFCHNVPIKEYDKFKKAVLNYAKSKEVKEGFAKDPVRFFKNRLWSWRDWIEAPKEAPLGDGAGQLTDEQRAKQRFGGDWRCDDACGSQDLQVTSTYSTGKVTAICRECHAEITFGA